MPSNSQRWQARKHDATITKEPTSGYMTFARKPGMYGQDQFASCPGTLGQAKQDLEEWYGHPLEWCTA